MDKVSCIKRKAKDESMSQLKKLMEHPTVVAGKNAIKHVSNASTILSLGMALTSPPTSLPAIVAYSTLGAGALSMAYTHYKNYKEAKKNKV
jgi:hypothetical protein